MSSRHLARGIALQILAQWDFNTSILGKSLDLNEVIKNNLEYFAPKNFDEKKFVEELVLGVYKNLDKIDTYIKEFAPHWPLDKITPVDRNILRLSIWEMMFSKNVPPKVAINEAVEIAKIFGNISSGKFVNGVLGTIYNKYKKDEER
jgi:N utilization substance protein B